MPEPQDELLYSQEQMVSEAQRVARGIVEVYAGKERVGVVTLALHLLVAQMGVQQGNTLEEVMIALAENVPLFFRKLHEAQAEVASKIVLTGMED